MRYIAGMVTALFLLGNMAPGAIADGERLPSAGAADGGLRASIIAERFYYADQPVLVTFRLENVGAEDLMLQEWRSPAAARRWHLMMEAADGDSVAFDLGLPLLTDAAGSRVQYRQNDNPPPAPPTVWRVIGPGEQLDVIVDLAERYDLAAPGEYSVGSIYASFRQEGELTEDNWPEELPLSWDGWQQHPQPPRVWEGVLFTNPASFRIYPKSGENYLSERAADAVEPEEMSALQMHEANENDEPVLLPNVMRPLLAVSPDEPAHDTYHNRFSSAEAVALLDRINEALEGFRLLTDDARRAGIIAPGSEDYPMTGWEEQHLGFPNWAGAVEGALRKQRMELARTRAELAGLKLANGTGSREEAVAAEEELRIATREFVAFWDSFSIAD